MLHPMRVRGDGCIKPAVKLEDRLGSGKLSYTCTVPSYPCYQDLRGKVALVSGGGTHIGRAICIRLADEGMHVVFFGRTQETLDETAGLIRNRGGQCTALKADVSLEEDVERLYDHIRQEHGRIDLVVHNAAIMRGGPLCETTLESWRKTFGVNAEGAFLLAQPAARMMIEQQSGVILLISTIGALQAHYRLVDYDSSKGAIETFTKAAALELGRHNVRVNAVAPGATRYRPVEESRSDNPDEILELGLEEPFESSTFEQQFIPMRRFGTAAEMAAAVAFLSSDQASYITGHTLVVDGGATAQLSPPQARI